MAALHRSQQAQAGGLAERLFRQESDSVLAELQRRRQIAAATYRDQSLTRIAPPLLALIKCTYRIGQTGIRDDITSAVSSSDFDPNLQSTLPLAILELALQQEDGTIHPTIVTLSEHWSLRYNRLLSEPIRAADDWSIHAILPCHCELCEVLETFLKSPVKQLLEWPLAKERRMHIHRVIDASELPLIHTTKRVGSPQKLIIQKTPALFARYLANREAWQKVVELTERVTTQNGISPSHTTSPDSTSP
ncbi:hypothetical protein C7S18_04550 [Ahniella affigens]|uniref:Uncharacterized protein n=1 Tax=Ahniella affigens TaxID=2021234 RepID=A0A2P1PNT4_9GAMM|nr:hypothetical protein [Ahniella affigens]AVP96511.1 hypothetical protein C7S18_04550 [Ahniella affigens]